MTIPEVPVAVGGGPVALRVAEYGRAHGVVSVVWRFSGLADPEGVVGEISRGLPQVPLGGPGAVDGKGFLVDGYVIPVTGRRASPYQVVVTVLQGGLEVHQAVPPDRGTGTIGSDEIRFRYPFVVKVK